MAKRHTPVKITPKQQALRDLDEARTLLGVHIHLASEEWNPRVILRQSMEKHLWAWVAAAGVGGLFLWRVLVPSGRSKNDRDISGASDTKKGFMALLTLPLLGMVRQAAVKYGTQFLQSYLTNQFSQHAAPKGDVTADHSSHV
jgi:hypothetical protein